MALSIQSISKSESQSSGSGGCLAEEIDIFPQFDVVSDDSDHHFLYRYNSKGKSGQAENLFANASCGVHKKIMQEWRILERNLPESITVRVYEKRIDLLRAAIVGAPGTPYHNGLFFFDLAFPPDYPARPPFVHYRSFGYRINPNLYETGRVCLSLLNTWVGRKREKWNPNESTVLQVLVSIQALVLNEKPFFNEPGLGILPGFLLENKSAAYNEEVFILCCKSMLFLMMKPPKNFEGFVAEHFRERGSLILAACKRYAAGRVKVSGKLKGFLGELYPKLAAAFIKTGASLGPSELHLNVNVQKRKHGIAKRVFRKLNKIFGLACKNVKK